ncbi:hypothetical protein EUGRSUZ_F01078 [Eucalyptus grandis]|uniref:Uncharacterized protein n=2 Tax=Eucalyptus grandis TaxID=71139 RepID=A0A059BMM2_EUCGR|nr:hypothetical protein EUGRSUZ_F01078 [Eucalyptus grandis]
MFRKPNLICQSPGPISTGFCTRQKCESQRRRCSSAIARVLSSIIFNLSLAFASAMAKNRNKKKRNAAADAMDVAEKTVSDGPQAMDTSESGAKSSAAGAANRSVESTCELSFGPA